MAKRVTTEARDRCNVMCETRNVIRDMLLILPSTNWGPAE